MGSGRHAEQRAREGSGITEAQTETTTYLDRGELGSLRLTNRTFVTGQFTAHFTDLSDASNATLYDLARKSGYFASAVSTLGANADAMTYKLVFTVEGTNFGDSADHVLTLNDVRVTVSVADNGWPSLSATQSFSVIVSDVNSTPILTLPETQTVDELTPLAENTGSAAPVGLVVARHV